jgi:HSP20 family protein
MKMGADPYQKNYSLASNGRRFTMVYRRFSSPVGREIEKMEREMNRLFGDIFAGRNRSSAHPLVNIWLNEAEEDILLTAELPGMSSDDINIAVEGNTLTFSGQRDPVDVPENGTVHRNECSRGEFSRSLRLPFMVDADKVSAEFRKGILRVTLPRAEADKPRKIAVKGN